jgi:hypothetical protein
MSVYNPGLGQGTHPVLTLSFLRFLYTLYESLSLHAQPWLRMAQIHAQIKYQTVNQVVIHLNQVSIN